VASPYGAAQGQPLVGILEPRRVVGALVCAVLLVSTLRAAPACSRPTPEEEIAQATHLFEIGRFDEAQAIVSRLRQSPDPLLQVLFLSGELYVLKQRYIEAAEEFRLMLARDPAAIILQPFGLHPLIPLQLPGSLINAATEAQPSRFPLLENASEDACAPVKAVWVHFTISKSIHCEATRGFCLSARSVTTIWKT